MDEPKTGEKVEAPFSLKFWAPAGASGLNSVKNCCEISNSEVWNGSELLRGALKGEGGTKLISFVSFGATVVAAKEAVGAGNRLVLLLP